MPDLTTPSATPPAALAVSPAELCELVAAVAASGVWADLVDEIGEERGKTLLSRTPAWELWLLSWRSGHSVEFHDHGGSHAALTVLTGSLVDVTLTADGLSSRLLTTGDIHQVAPNSVHDVVNLAAADAWSLHAYSPRLRSMTFFDPVTRRPERVVAVQAEEPVLEPGALSRWWHPAGRA